jgi:sodium-coupled neutral amino acid transporter 10
VQQLPAQFVMHFFFLLQEHKKHVAETKVLKSIAADLRSVTDEMKKTHSSVEAVMQQLDSTIAQLKAEAMLQANVTAAASAAAAAAASAAATISADTASGGLGSINEERVSNLAAELGKAMGSFSNVTKTVITGVQH